MGQRFESSEGVLGQRLDVVVFYESDRQSFQRFTHSQTNGYHNDFFKLNMENYMF